MAVAVELESLVPVTPAEAVVEERAVRLLLAPVVQLVLVLPEEMVALVERLTAVLVAQLTAQVVVELTGTTASRTLEQVAEAVYTLLRRHQLVVKVVSTGLVEEALQALEQTTELAEQAAKGSSLSLTRQVRRA